jgi:hypothetical protein
MGHPYEGIFCVNYYKIMAYQWTSVVKYSLSGYAGGKLFY